MGTLVTETPAASSDVALSHFEGMLGFETDCWDVHESLRSPKPDFILVDVRGPVSFANGHVQGAINIPHGQMTASRMADFPKDKLFVVYCAGPHCNGANKAALRLARLGLPVKMMIGGITGWIDEGFSLAAEAKGHIQARPKELKASVGL
jgi:rhodanese-related sulfurtransferase